MHAPIIAGATAVLEAGGVDQEDAARLGEHEGSGRRRSGKEFSEQPEEPGIGFAEALAPGGVGDVGEAEEDSPGTESAEGVNDEDVGEEGTQEQDGSLKFTDAVEGTEVLGLEGELIGQQREDLGIPEVSEEGGRLRGVWSMSMMGGDRHGRLLWERWSTPVLYRRAALSVAQSLL